MCWLFEDKLQVWPELNPLAAGMSSIKALQIKDNYFMI